MGAHWSVSNSFRIVPHKIQTCKTLSYVIFRQIYASMSPPPQFCTLCIGVFEGVLMVLMFGSGMHILVFLKWASLILLTDTTNNTKWNISLDFHLVIKANRFSSSMQYIHERLVGKICRSLCALLSLVDCIHFLGYYIHNWLSQFRPLKFLHSFKHSTKLSK